MPSFGITNSFKTITPPLSFPVNLTTIFSNSLFFTHTVATTLLLITFGVVSELTVLKIVNPVANNSPPFITTSNMDCAYVKELNKI